VKKIKILGSGNRGEYSSSEFVNLCTHARIIRHMTMPYNPYKNEVSERKNLAIVVP
jgi:transposase InsO family protein